MKAPDKIYVPAEIAKSYKTNSTLYKGEPYVRIDALLDMVGTSGDSLLVEFIAGLIDRIK